MEMWSISSGSNGFRSWLGWSAVEKLRKMERPILADRRLEVFKTVAGRDPCAECGGPVASFSTGGAWDEEGDS